MPQSAGSSDSKTAVMGQRTYRVSARMLENFQDIIFFVSPIAHVLWQLQKLYFSEIADDPKVTEISHEKLPPGFRLLDQAIVSQFNRDVARYAMNFNPATHEELLASKFRESGGDRRTLKGDLSGKQD